MSLPLPSTEPILPPFVSPSPRLPDVFVKRLHQFYPDQVLDILKGFESERIGSFRVNTLNASVEEVLKEFSEKKIEATEYTGFSGVSGDRFFVYTFEKSFEYAIKGTDAFYKGKIYLQSLASMLPVLLLAPQKNTYICDVCSAPGSKTTQLAMMTNNESEILALEKNQIRYQKLQHNLLLQGAEEAVSVCKIDALKFFKNETSIRPTKLFDVILLDAPCSAEGRITLDREKSYGFWKLKNVLEKSHLQYDLLSSALPHLKSGGVLMYSTCTLAPEENEGVVARILADFPEMILDTLPLFSEKETVFQRGLDVYGVEIGAKTIKVMPSRQTEGFFIAKFTKI